MNFTHSSQQFTREVSDLECIESLDSEVSRRFFRGFLTRKPTLKEALYSAGIPMHELVADDAMVCASGALEDPEISSLGLTEDEAGLYRAILSNCLMELSLHISF